MQFCIATSLIGLFLSACPSCHSHYESQHPMNSILCYQNSVKPGIGIAAQLLDFFKDLLSCIIQQLQVSECAEVVPATATSVALLLASSKPVLTVRKTSQPGLLDHCYTNNGRRSLSNEPESVDFVAR